MSGNNFENDELTIDFNKIGRIIHYRKLFIIACFILMIVITLFLTFVSPKKYVSEAKLLINKTSSTNLADINPFIVSDISSAGGGGLSSMLNSSSNLNNEIEILKSPLVINLVIKENNLKYKKGPKEGKYLSVNDFFGKNIQIENLRASNIITISYNSQDRVLAYNIVNSIIKNYKEVYEIINSTKASKDKSFLQKSYLSAQNSVNEKIANLKSYSAQNTAKSNSIVNLTDIILGKYDKRIQNDFSSAKRASIESQKLQTELDLELEKLKMLKQKYEWTSLVENMSKNTSNMIILKYPELPEAYEYKKSNLIKNIFLALIFSFSLSSIMVFVLEKMDPKLTYSELDENGIICDKYSDIDISDIKANIMLKNIKNISLVSLANERLSNNFSNLVSQNFKNTDIKFKLTEKDDPIDKHLQNIMSSEYVVFLVQLGLTNKKHYYKLKNICKKAQKESLVYFIAFKNENSVTF